jgi:hypothetical protein
VAATVCSARAAGGQPAATAAAAAAAAAAARVPSSLSASHTRALAHSVYERMASCIISSAVRVLLVRGGGGGRGRV